MLVLATAILVPAAVATGAPQPTLAERLEHFGYRAGAAVERIPRYEVEGWHHLDDTHFILDTGPSHSFLITLMFPCSGIDFAENIRFSTTPPGDLTRFDEIIVRQPGVPQHCPIQAIDALTPIPRKP
jgi:hypothetical protein